MLVVGNNNVLVVAAHPDDEVLGCGGTIARLTEKGVAVHVAFLSDGVTSRETLDESNEMEIACRRTSAMRSCEILGVQSTSFENFPDNCFDTVPLLKLVKAVEQLVEYHAPGTVITHHLGDLNIDHCLTHKAVFTACRPQPSSVVKTILCFEVPSSTEWQSTSNINPFTPNFFVDISKTIDRKFEALGCYEQEMRQWPHSRSYESLLHLNRWRGSTVGVDASEAFVLGRSIIN